MVQLLTLHRLDEDITGQVRSVDRLTAGLKFFFKYKERWGGMVASREEVALLKKELVEISAEFRDFRDKVKSMVETEPDERTTFCGVYFKCEPCIAWTQI